MWDAIYRVLFYCCCHRLNKTAVLLSQFLNKTAVLLPQYFEKSAVSIRQFFYLCGINFILL